jgi:hypothetical protein
MRVRGYLRGYPGPSNLRLFYRAAVLLLLLILGAELLESSRRLSQTADEAAHLYAGYQHWRAHDFGVNPEHPPLVKMVAAAPLLRMDLKQPHPPNPYFMAEQYIGGGELLYENDPDVLLRRSRTAVSAFTLLLALLVFFAGYEMFGPSAGLLGLALFTFEPTLLAHGALVTTDMGVTAFIFASVYAFYRYVKQPGPGRLLVFSVAVGLAAVSKLSGVIVLPMLVVCAVGDLLPAWDAKRALRLAGAIFFSALVAYGMVWSFYQFRYAARPAGLAINPTLAQFVLQLPKSWESRMVLSLARWHVLPEAYLYGWTKLPIDQKDHPMFLLGKVYSTGQWFYFPTALLIKSSLTLLLLVGMAPMLYVRGLRPYRREVLFLAGPLVMFLAFTMTSHLNIGVRHALPVYPFAVVLAGATAWIITRVWRVGRYVVAVAMVLLVVSSARTFPSYLAYANEAFGGRDKAYRVLSDSNVDWGQELMEVGAYLKDHHIQDCWFAYSLPNLPMERYGIACKPLPTGLSLWTGIGQPIVPAHIDGVVLVGAMDSSGTIWGGGDMNPYQRFQEGRPNAIIGSTVLVYRGSYDIPLAAAQSHYLQTGTLLREGKVPEALAEAHAGIAIAPEAAVMQVELGGVLTSLHRDAEAAVAFEEAKRLARIHRPENQSKQVSEMIAFASSPHN